MRTILLNPHINMKMDYTDTDETTNRKIGSFSFFTNSTLFSLFRLFLSTFTFISSHYSCLMSEDRSKLLKYSCGRRSEAKHITNGV